MYGASNAFPRFGRNTIPLNSQTPTDPPRDALGTYRVPNYREVDLPPPEVLSVARNWKECPPISIVTREKALHLTLAELRVEDYFLIRTQRLSGHDASNLQKSIRAGNFNEQLVGGNCSLLPFTREAPVDLDSLRHQADTRPSFGGSQGNHSSNIFSRTHHSHDNTSNYGQNSNHAFPRSVQPDHNRPTHDSVGFYGSNSANGQYGHSGNGQNGQGGNIFNSARNGQNSSYNIFNNNGAGNNAASSTGNPMGRASNSNANSTNIFNNFASGVRNNSSNPTNSNPQQPNIQANPFTNNAPQHHAPPVSTNSNNSSSGNAFNNCSTNSNNLQSHHSPNLFNQNNSAISQNCNSFTSNQTFPQQNQCNTMAQQQSQTHPSLFANHPHFNSNSNQSFFPMQMVGNCPVEFLTSQAAIFDGMVKEIEKRMVQRLPWAQRQQFPTQDSSETLGYEAARWEEEDERVAVRRKRHEPIKVTVVHKDKEAPRRFRRNQQQNYKQNEIPNVDTLPVLSRLNSQDQLFKNISISGKKCSSAAIRGCESYSYSVRLTIRWTDLEDIVSEGVEVVKDGMVLPWVDLESSEGLELLVHSLKKEFPVIRGDAHLVVSSSQPSGPGQQLVVGVIEQRLVNLELSTYGFRFSRIEHGKIFNFTITNKSSAATMAWQHPIQYEQLDFSAPESFSLELSEVTCAISALNSPCRITFHALPPKIDRICRQTGRREAERRLRAFIEAKNEDERIFSFCEMGEDGCWSIMVAKFD